VEDALEQWRRENTRREAAAKAEHARLQRQEQHQMEQPRTQAWDDFWATVDQRIADYVAAALEQERMRERRFHRGVLSDLLAQVFRRLTKLEERGSEVAENEKTHDVVPLVRRRVVN
jgi:hypothetical protein